MPARRAVLVPERRGVDPGVHFLLIVVTGVIFFVAGRAYDWFDQPVVSPQVIAAPVVPPAQTVVVLVNLPPDPTATRTPIPTVAPTAQPTTDYHADDCNRRTPVPQPGDVCRTEPFPTNTPAPMPTCPVSPGDLCVWPRSNETTGRPEAE